MRKHKPKRAPVNSSEERKANRKRPYSAPTVVTQGGNRHPVSGRNLSLPNQWAMRKNHEI